MLAVVPTLVCAALKKERGGGSPFLTRGCKVRGGGEGGGSVCMRQKHVPALNLKP